MGKSVALVVESSFPPVSRANLRLYRLSLVLIKKRLRVFIVSPGNNLVSTKQWTNADLTVVQHPGLNYALYRDRFRLIVRFLHLCAGILTLVRLRRRTGLSVIHAWHPIASLEAIFAGMITRTSVVVDWTDFYSDIAKHESPALVPFFRLIEPFILSHAVLINTVSDEMAQALVDIGAKRDKIRVIPDGVDTSLFNPGVDGAEIRERYNLANSPTVIFHGDIKPIDGVDLLVSAFKKVSLRIPSAKLLIVGGGGAYFEFLKNLVDRSNLGSSIVFTGWVLHAEIPKYLAAANLGVMPLLSTLETNSYLSFKLFEYWGMGKPVVVSKVRAISRLVENCDGGVLVSPGDIGGFADSICQLLEDPKRGRSMGARGRSLVESKFDWNLIMSEEANLYESLLQQNQ